MQEIWKDVIGYEGSYKISNNGNVISCTRVVDDARLGTKTLNQKFLKPTVDSVGYVKVTLYRETKKKVFKVHRLVALHFCDKPSGCEIVNHLDNDKQNNYYENLEWTTPLGNNQHMCKQGRNRNHKGEECSWTNLTEADVLKIRDLCSQGVAQTSIGLMYGISQQQVSKINLKLRWKHL